MIRFISALIFVFILCFSISSAGKRLARVHIDSRHIIGEVSPALFGDFIESIHFKFNSPRGLHAQELVNRGFDNWECFEKYVACPWRAYNNSKYTDYRLLTGGYNNNGAMRQKIYKYDSLESGVMQSVYINNDSGYEFYVYVRGDVEKAFISIYDTTLTDLLYRFEFDSLSANWKKIGGEIPKIDSLYRIAFVISFEGKGSVDIDEASLMPKNNVYGIKREYYDLYEKWRPFSIRYPGGWFAEWREYKMLNSVGDIDRRTSPAYLTNHYQRLDFGLDEFVAFCKSLGIKPSLTIGLDNHTPEEAASVVEYCNSSSLTEYGKMRAENGFPEPYNIEYWQIGNERWDDPINTAKIFPSRSNSMRNVDPNIKTIMNGNVWGGYDFVEACSKYAAETFDYYSWHFGASHNLDLDVSEEMKHKSILCTAFSVGDLLTAVQDYMTRLEVNAFAEQAIPEYWQGFNNYNWEDHPRTKTLEAGIWHSLMLQSFVKHSSILKFAGCASINCVVDAEFTEEDKRVVFGSPAYYAQVMMKNHVGAYALATNVECEEFDVPEIEGLYWRLNNPWISAVATFTEDSLFLSVVNAHPTDTAMISTNFDDFKTHEFGKAYVLTSEHYLDRNTAENPEKITAQEIDWRVASLLQTPPSSHIIFAAPLVEPLTSDSVSGSEAVVNLSARPNPCDEQVTVLLSKPILGFATFGLYDSIGGKIYETENVYGRSSFTLDMSGLAAGPYLAKITTAGQTRSILIVKNR